MSKVVLVLLLTSACGDVAEQVVQPDDLAGIAEAYCATHPELPCGTVYACATPADDPIGLVEFCIPQPFAGDPTRPTLADAEAMYGACTKSPDERFKKAGSWLCWWGCPATGPGCNAYSGCLCQSPTPSMPDAGVDAAPMSDMPKVRL